MMMFWDKHRPNALFYYGLTHDLNCYEKQNKTKLQEWVSKLKLHNSVRSLELQETQTFIESQR